MRRATLHAMCPTELANHVDLHIYRLDTCDALKAEIERHLEQAVARTSGPVPIEGGSLHRGDPKGGRGKGREGGRRGHPGAGRGKNHGGKGDRAKKFTGGCNRCGRPGHKKSECYAKTDKDGNALHDTPPVTKGNPSPEGDASERWTKREGGHKG